MSTSVNGPNRRRDLAAGRSSPEALEVQSKAAETAAQGGAAGAPEAAPVQAVGGQLGEMLTTADRLARATGPAMPSRERARLTGQAKLDAQKDAFLQGVQRSLENEAASAASAGATALTQARIATPEQLGTSLRREAQFLARSNPDAFRGIPGQAYGLPPGSAEAARMLEQARQGSLPLPANIEFVDRSVLDGNNAAYSPEKGGTVFLSSDLVGDDRKLRQAFAEELGHHLDPRRARGGDSQGDEGQIFAMGLSQRGKLDETELQSARRDRDRGEIVVNGHRHTVEFQAATPASAVTSSAETADAARLPEAASAAQATDSPREISNRLAAVPEKERGRAVAEMLRSGQITSSQVADYVAGAETGKATAALSFERASALLGSSMEPALQKAVAQGLDRLVAPDLWKRGPQSPEQKASVQKLESQMRNFFESNKVGAEAKLRLAETVGAHSQNPTLRAASAVVLSAHLNPLQAHLAGDRKKLEESYNMDRWDEVPGGLANLDNHRRQLRQDIEHLERYLPRMQEALARTLFGKDQEIPEESGRTLGKLIPYLEQHHSGSVREQRQAIDPRHPHEIGKDVMRALFNPPSIGAMAHFMELGKSVTASTDRSDAQGLGYLLECGHQALVVDPKAAGDEQLALAGRGLQIALAGILGGLGGPMAAALASSDQIKEVLASMLSKAGEEGLGWALDELAKQHRLSADILVLRDDLGKLIADYDSARDFEAGGQKARSRLEEQR